NKNNIRDLPLSGKLQSNLIQLEHRTPGVGVENGITPCSLIPGFGVKLSAIILAGPTVLSAVGACPPHDGVRRRWWINVASAVSLIESSQKIGRSHHRH